MSDPRLTAEQLERVVASLCGLRITAIGYAVLAGGADGREPGIWDYGDWHEPAMGCQLASDIGVEFVVWDSTFGGYGLEVHDRPIGRFLSGVDEPFGPVVLPVGDHPRWHALLGREIVGAEAGWIEWVSGSSTPYQVRLDFAPARPELHDLDSVWLVSGRWDGNRFITPTDDVTVIFDAAQARRARLLPNT